MHYTQVWKEGIRLKRYPCRELMRLSAYSNGIRYIFLNVLYVYNLISVCSKIYIQQS
jgi:hypothetical protein